MRAFRLTSECVTVDIEAVLAVEARRSLKSESFESFEKSYLNVTERLESPQNFFGFNRPVARNFQPKCWWHPRHSTIVQEYLQKCKKKRKEWRFVLYYVYLVSVII
jgi:hypothetical protein